LQFLWLNSGVNLTLAPIVSKLLILYINMECSVLLNVGSIHRSKNIWRVRVTIVLTAIQKLLIVCIVEQHVAVRTVKRAVSFKACNVFVGLKINGIS
jgi:hypothetical protein